MNHFHYFILNMAILIVVGLFWKCSK